MLGQKLLLQSQAHKCPGIPHLSLNLTHLLDIPEMQSVEISLQQYCTKGNCLF